MQNDSSLNVTISGHKNSRQCDRKNRRKDAPVSATPQAHLTRNKVEVLQLAQLPVGYAKAVDVATCPRHHIALVTVERRVDSATAITVTQSVFAPKDKHSAGDKEERSQSNNSEKTAIARVLVEERVTTVVRQVGDVDVDHAKDV